MTWLFGLSFSNFSDLFNASYRVVAALLVLVLSVWLASAGLRAVFAAGRKPEVLLQYGVYAVVRHPVYLAEILFYSGLLLLCFSVAAFLTWLIIITFLHYIAGYEEKLLLHRFGADYETYRIYVPMWLPKL